MATGDIITLGAEDYKITLLINNKSYPILTADKISFQADVESEKLHVIGQSEAFANKVNGQSYSGSLKMQVGEFQGILKLAGSKGATKLRNCNLSIASLGAAPLFIRSYSGVNFNSESIDISAKDKSTFVDLKWDALDFS